MSKGKKGEMRIVRTVTVVALREPDVDFTRHTTTNTADRGEDLNLRAPSNLGEKFEDIIKNGTTNIQSSDKKINIRIDGKNKKADKDDVEKFVDDIKKNPGSDEHWLIYQDISKPGRKVINDAKKVFTKPIRAFSFDEILKVEHSYSALEEYDENKE